METPKKKKIQFLTNISLFRKFDCFSLISLLLSSIQFSCSFVSDSLWVAKELYHQLFLPLEYGTISEIFIISNILNGKERACTKLNVVRTNLLLLKSQLFETVTVVFSLMSYKILNDMLLTLKKFSIQWVGDKSTI